MTKYLPILLIFLGGCYFSVKHTIHADLINCGSTPLGIQFSIDKNIQIPKETIANWIDQQFNLWVSHKKEWGCDGWTDSQLLAIVETYSIYVYNGYSVQGDGRKIYWGYTWYNESVIDIALDYPALFFETMNQYDPGQWPLYDEFGNQIGMSGLGHEFTHVILGNWHPE